MTEEEPADLAELLATLHRQSDPAADGPDRYRRLPAHVALEDTVEEQDTMPVPDPTGGRDVERDRLLLQGGAG